MSLNRFWVWVQRWFLLILAPLFIAFNILFALHFTRPASHEASVKLQVSVPQTDEVSINDRYRFSNLLDEVRTSRSNFLDILNESSTFEQAKENFINERDSLLSGQLLEEPFDANAFDYDLTVGAIRDADFLSIHYSSSSPEEAVAIANLHTELAIDSFGKVRALPIRALQENLLSQLESSNKTLTDAKDALVVFQLEHGFSSVNDEISLREELIASMKREQVRLLAEDRRNEAALNRITLSISETQAELLGLLKLGPEFGVLETAIQEEESRYARLLDKANEADITANTIEAATFIQVVQAAALPAKKLTPYLDYLPLAVLGSLGLGLLLAYLMTFLLARLRKDEKPEDLPVLYNEPLEVLR